MGDTATKGKRVQQDRPSTAGSATEDGAEVRAQTRFTGAGEIPPVGKARASTVDAPASATQVAFDQPKEPTRAEKKHARALIDKLRRYDRKPVDPVEAEAAAAELSELAAGGDAAALSVLRGNLGTDSRTARAQIAAALARAPALTADDLADLVPELAAGSAAAAVVDERIAAGDPVWVTPAREALAGDRHNQHNLLVIYAGHPEVFDDTATADLLAACKRGRTRSWSWLEACVNAPAIPTPVLAEIAHFAAELEGDRSDQARKLAAVLRPLIAAKVEKLVAELDAPGAGEDSGTGENAGEEVTEAAVDRLATLAALGDERAIERLAKAASQARTPATTRVKAARALAHAPEPPASAVAIVVKHLADDVVLEQVTGHLAAGRASWIEPARAALARHAAAKHSTLTDDAFVLAFASTPEALDDAAIDDLIATRNRKWVKACIQAPSAPARVLEKFVAYAESIEEARDLESGLYMFRDVLRAALATKYGDNSWVGELEPRSYEYGKPFELTEHDQEVMARSQLEWRMTRFAAEHGTDPEVARTAISNARAGLENCDPSSIDALVDRAIDGSELAADARGAVIETVAKRSQAVGPRVVERLANLIENELYKPRAYGLLGEVAAVLQLEDRPNSKDGEASRRALARANALLREGVKNEHYDHSSPARVGSTFGGLASLAGASAPRSGESRLELATLGAAIRTGDPRARGAFDGVARSLGPRHAELLDILIDSVNAMELQVDNSLRDAVADFLVRGITAAQYRRFHVGKLGWERTATWRLDVLELNAHDETRRAVFDDLRAKGYMPEDDRARLAMAELAGEATREDLRMGDLDNKPLEASRRRQQFVRRDTPEGPIQSHHLRHVQGVANDLLQKDLEDARKEKDSPGSTGRDLTTDEVDALVELGDWLSVIAIAERWEHERPEDAKRVDVDKARRNIEHLTSKRLQPRIQRNQETALGEANFARHADAQIAYLTQSTDFLVLFLAATPEEQTRLLGNELMKLQMAAPDRAEDVAIQTMQRLAVECAKRRAAVGARRLESGDYTDEELELSLVGAGVPRDVVARVVECSGKGLKAVELADKVRGGPGGAPDAPTEGGPREPAVGGLLTLAGLGLSGVSIAMAAAKEDWWSVTLNSASAVGDVGDVATKLFGVCEKVPLIKVLGLVGAAANVASAFTTMSAAGRDREMGDWKGAGFKTVEAYASLGAAAGSALVIAGIASGGWLLVAAIAVGLGAWLLDNLYGESEDESLVRKMGALHSKLGD